MIRSIFVFLVLGCHVAFAEAVAKISGPATSQVGSPVVLVTQGSVGNVIKWQFVGQNPPESTVLFEGGLLFIPSKSGNYSLILAAADGQTVDATIHVITVSPRNGPRVSIRATVGGLPDIASPGRSRVRTARQSSSLARGKFGLAAYTRRMASSLIDDNYMKVCPKMAANFREVAQNIDEGFHKDRKAAEEALGKKNKADMNGGKKAWVVFFGSIERRLDELAKDGELVTLSDYAMAFRETAAGLDAAAKEEA
jgi:hypothetical protein